MRLIDADELTNKYGNWYVEEGPEDGFIGDLKHLIDLQPTIAPSEQPEQDREFIRLTVRDSNGRPYYSIIYLEVDANGVGHDVEGYSSYSLDVISDYLKKYFMPSTQPEYKPVRVEDIAKTMAENTLFSFSAWHGEALELMQRYGFVICKKKM